MSHYPQTVQSPVGRAKAQPDGYFTSTVAPASANFFLMDSASSLLTPSLMVLGAPSTRSLASFRPRLVTSRTTLMTLILFAPAAVRTTVNSVFSSTGAAAAAPPPPAAGAAATAAAAADTPKASSIPLTSCDASSSVSDLIWSRIALTSAILFPQSSVLKSVVARERYIYTSPARRLASPRDGTLPLRELFFLDRLVQCNREVPGDSIQ